MDQLPMRRGFLKSLESMNRLCASSKSGAETFHNAVIAALQSKPKEELCLAYFLVIEELWRSPSSISSVKVLSNAIRSVISQSPASQAAYNDKMIEAVFNEAVSHGALEHTNGEVAFVAETSASSCSLRNSGSAIDGDALSKDQLNDITRLLVQGIQMFNEPMGRISVDLRWVLQLCDRLLTAAAYTGATRLLSVYCTHVPPIYVIHVLDVLCASDNWIMAQELLETLAANLNKRQFSTDHTSLDNSPYAVYAHQYAHHHYNKQIGGGIPAIPLDEVLRAYATASDAALRSYETMLSGGAPSALPYPSQPPPAPIVSAVPWLLGRALFNPSTNAFAAALSLSRRFMHQEDVNAMKLSQKKWKYQVFISKSKWQIGWQMSRMCRQEALFFDLLLQAQRFIEADSIYEEGRLFRFRPRVPMDLIEQQRRWIAESCLQFPLPLEHVIVVSNLITVNKAIEMLLGRFDSKDPHQFMAVGLDSEWYANIFQGSRKEQPRPRFAATGREKAAQVQKTPDKMNQSVTSSSQTVSGNSIENTPVESPGEIVLLANGVADVELAETETKDDLEDIDVDDNLPYKHGANILQIATTSSVVIVDFDACHRIYESCLRAGQPAKSIVASDPFLSRVAELLSGLFSREDILKVGWSFGNSDIHMIRSAAGGIFRDVLHSENIRTMLELTGLIKCAELSSTTITQKAAKSNSMSLSESCEQLLGKPLDKGQQLSNWSQRPLTAEQRRYAALDAHSLLGMLDITLAKVGVLDRCGGGRYYGQDWNDTKASELPRKQEQKLRGTDDGIPWAEWRSVFVK